MSTFDCNFSSSSSGLRCITPYYYTFNCYAKGRWLGRTLFDVFTAEFKMETPEHYVCMYE